MSSQYELTPCGTPDMVASHLSLFRLFKLECPIRSGEYGIILDGSHEKRRPVSGTMLGITKQTNEACQHQKLGVSGTQIEGHDLPCLL